MTAHPHYIGIIREPAMRQYLRTSVRAGLTAAFVAFTAIAVAQVAPPAPAPIITNTARFLPVVARNGMVVAQEKLATHVGVEILRTGGNAVDAAVAVGFALAVTHPQAGNIGGGGFMLVHLASRNETIAIDYRETAPAAMTRDVFLDEKGEADPRKSRDSALGVGVPGTVAGLALAHDPPEEQGKEEKNHHPDKDPDPGGAFGRGQLVVWLDLRFRGARLCGFVPGSGIANVVLHQ